jgi:hypothetical protein
VVLLRVTSENCKIKGFPVDKSNVGNLCSAANTRLPCQMRGAGCNTNLSLKANRPLIAAVFSPKLFSVKIFKQRILFF